MKIFDFEKLIIKLKEENILQNVFCLRQIYFRICYKFSLPPHLFSLTITFTEKYNKNNIIEMDESQI